MGNKNCIYFVEGSCEKKLVDMLKNQPELLIPGKTIVFNVLTHRITKGRLMDIKNNSTIVFVFDTDGEKDTTILNQNIKLLKTYIRKAEIIFLIQVNNLEDELVKATDIYQIRELTKSRSNSDFKTDFINMSNSWETLQKHHFDIKKIWITPTPNEFRLYEQNSYKVKITKNSKSH